MNRRTLLALLAASTAMAAVGCGRGFNISTPTGFAELDDQERYDYRATNAEGVVLAVRREDNKPYGDLGFWSGAVDAYLHRKGYVAVKSVAVTSADGVSGRQVRYRTHSGGREKVFWVAVFVTEDAVVTVEAGGDVAYFKGVESSLTNAIASLELT